MRFFCLCVLAVLAFSARAAAAEPPALTAQPLQPRSSGPGATMFKVIPPEASGIRTTNAYSDPKMWNELYHEFELGAIGTGVAIGDYDGDGLPDIFVVSKTESCRLFHNLGNCKFEDVTDRAGVGDQGEAAAVWKQGATWADVNNDGELDLYVCRFNAPNLLYINQGNGTFREEARARGLDIKDASGMASFCDYDRDGWLDVYIATNLLDGPKHPAGQRGYLLHNNKDGTFTNVSDAAGMHREETQSHSATWWDFDNDGWPDLYVTNDFAGPDYLYRNNRDGTFTDVISQVVPHMPYSSMGADLGDVNNDGLIDFLATEMAAIGHERDQRGMADTRAFAKDPAEGSTQPPGYLWNALYLNTGTGRCLEAAHLAGVAATDWTWSVRLEDLDNDGRLDLYATNGMHREINNTDLLNRMMMAESAAERIRIARASPVLVQPNLAFRNHGDLEFENVGAAWGLDQRGVSFGAAFGDLDGDGDLDLVYANFLGGVTVLRNDSPSGHRAIFALRGTRSNRFGVGATLKVESDSGEQVRQLVLARGYMSSSEPVLHFGLGEDPLIRRLTVTWPSGQVQTFENLAVDQRYVIAEPAGAGPAPAAPVPPPAQFTDVSERANLAWPSREEVIDEIAQQRLLPMRTNRRGPGLAVGDVSGDGADDLVIGGTTLDPARLLLGDPSGRFLAVGGPIAGTGGPANGGPVLVFDANGDGRNDLLVTRGGNSLPAGASEYQPVLFLNSGSGLEAAPAGFLPPLSESIGAAAAVDFNHDGRLDLFLGARVLPGQYPLSPRSALLVNRGDHFEDVTDQIAPALREVGMVNGALWSDVDGDGWPDLLLAVEWGTVRYFHNNQGRGFEDRSLAARFAAAGAGWWTGLASADFNGDGRPDYVVGNAGLNTRFRADPAHPALLYYGSFKEDGDPVAIEAYFEGEKIYPVRSRRELSAAIPGIMKSYPRNDFFARATLEEILGAKNLAAAQRFAATELRSGVFLSQPDGTYRFSALPRLAQIAPFQGVVAGDFDGDGHPDIYAVQNSYAPAPSTGNFDGGLSQLLRGDGRGNFAAVPVRASGLIVPGDAKALAVVDLDHDGWPDFVVSRNNSTTLAFRNQGTPAGHSLAVRLHGPAGNPDAIGARISARHASGRSQAGEVFAGSGYYSQSTPACFFGAPDGDPVVSATITWPDGRTSVHPVPPGSRQIDLSVPAR